MDVSNDGTDLIITELYLCLEVTQHHDRGSKIEKALYSAQRQPKHDHYFLAYVTRRKLHFQQLVNALRNKMNSVIQGVRR